jgi:hypothetical protein
MNDESARIDAALDGLAAADAQVIVPAQVRANVLREWDERQAGWTAPAAPRSRVEPRDGVPLRARALTAAATAAAAALFVAVLRWGPARPSSDSGVLPAETPVAADVAAMAPAPEAPSGERPATSPAREVARPVRALPAPVTGYVIVPEPLVDRAALHLVRVRMSSMALATLGMPIVNPDADGLVDVEMLVGDDGVTQSIRRASFVTEQLEIGGEP